MSFSSCRFFGNAAGAPGNHSYNLSFNDFQNLCIQFVFSSMYLCIYIATYRHLRYPWISVHPPSLINNVLGGRDWASWDMHLEAEIAWTQRCTWRPGSSELRDALGGCDCANWEAEIERVWRYTWWLWLSEFGDALGGCDWASVEMHLEAVMKWDWTSTWRGSMDGTPGAETLFISWLTRNRGNVTMWLYLWALMESWLMAVDCVGRYAESWSCIQGSTRNHENEEKPNNLGWMLYSVYAVLGVCCTRCMLYSLSTHDHVMER